MSTNGSSRPTRDDCPRLETLLAGKVDVVLFTTGVQIDHFLEFAGLHGKRDAALGALRRAFDRVE